MTGIRRRNLKNIQKIFEEKTGVAVAESSFKAGNYMKGGLAFAAGMLCLVSISAFGYGKLSGINGDELAFDAYYKGNGVFEIGITNLSDKELELQDMVKLMQWSTSREVEGDSDKIKMENTKIAAHSEGTVLVDLSQGYDIALLEKDLPGSDWYYLVLTNNYFVFGQDWMCTLDFDREKQPDTGKRYGVQTGSTEEGNGHDSGKITDNAAENQGRLPGDYKEMDSGFFAVEGWTWPTESKIVSVFYGEQSNGSMSDHVNIAGSRGDEVYAVADGKVLETGFEKECGNYVVLGLENDTNVRYGHLKEYNVEAGDMVSQGQVIGTLGKSGLATGPSLLLKVVVKGESVNPFAE